MSRIRIVLADDHIVLREGLRSVINSQPDLLVEAEAGTGTDAVNRVRETGANVLSLDLSMPGCGGISTIKRVRAESPKTGILILTMHDDPEYVRAAFAAGAHGYLLKTAPASEYLAGIRGVAAGQRVVDPGLQKYLDEPSSEPRSKPVLLSRREREILEHLTLGLTHHEISARLLISEKTVETVHLTAAQRAVALQNLALPTGFEPVF